MADREVLYNFRQAPTPLDHVINKQEISGVEPSSSEETVQRQLAEIEQIVERVCHKEQIGIWANELATALSLGDFLKEDWTFDDSVDLQNEIEAQLLDIIKSALTHPGYDVADRIEAQNARIKGLEEALQDIAAATDADDPESYRSDDREGCLDTVHSIARLALSHPKQEGQP